MMRRREFLSGWCLGGPLLLRADESVEHREVIQKTYTLSGAGDPFLLVDNIEGSIRVVGHAEKTIEVRAEKRIRARSADKLAAAQREVRLDMDQQGNEVRLYVDGPFRAPEGGTNYRGRDYYGYDVRFDYELRVPLHTNQILKTVNAGEIRVQNVRGEFDVRNVNGSIDMTQVAGYGSVHTINGHVTVMLDSAPAKPTRFATLNGPVEIRLPANLSADVKIKNRWNGSVYTDFDMVPLAPLPPTVEQTGGKFRYRTSEFVPFRIGKGGPELTFETFNGTIRILSQAR